MITPKCPPDFDPADLVPRPAGTPPWRVASLALDVSGRCNLACRYCAEGATQPTRRPMSRETLEAAWHFLFPTGQTHRYNTIRLGSGEPLLAFDLLLRLRELIDTSSSDAGERPSVFLTTNGTLIDTARANWLIDSGWHVKISLDGPPAIQDRWRVDRHGAGTFGRIVDVVRRFAREIPDRFSVTAVLCRDTDPAEVFMSIAGLGVRRIELVPASHRSESVTPSQADVERYARFVRDHARQWADAADAGDLPTLVRLSNCVARVMGYDLCEVSCGAGRVFLGVDPDGDLYPCFRFVGIEKYRLGNVFTGPDPDLVARFAGAAGQPHPQRETCRACWAAPLCGGPCFACSEMFGTPAGEPPRINCAYTLADAEAAVWLVRQLQPTDPERLLCFLPGEIVLA